MLKRYTLEEMQQLWMREASKFEYWLKVEIASLKARAHRNLIPEEVPRLVEQHAVIDVARIDALEAEFDQDMIAFVVSVQESLVLAGYERHKNLFHDGLTSYDVEDPALVLMLRQAVNFIIRELTALEQALRQRAEEHKWTLMIARTHGQYAEPDTFGHLLLVYAEGIARGIRRFQQVLSYELHEAKMSGAVGSYGGSDPELERLALSYLNLVPAHAETQIVQRDRIAILLSVIATTGATIEQMCRTFWEMMRSDVGELQEPRRKKQRGSSAMSHKRNPILTERGQGMPRLLRAAALAGFENIATPEGRDISQSSVERHILPDATAILHYLASKMTSMVQRLVVFPEQMRYNLDAKTLGVWATQPVRRALMRAGIDYDTAYEYTQRCSFLAVEQKVEVKGLFRKIQLSETDRRVAADVIGEETLESCFDARAYIQDGIEHIFTQRTPNADI